MILRTALLAVTICLAYGPALSEALKLAVTTSFHNSGLSEVLLPEFKSDSGLAVHLIVVGTGQAIRLGKAGDVDAILVHSRNAEDAFVADGFGTHRREVMYNDFVVIGPVNDPANVADADSAASAFAAIAAAKAPFASRGDDSGTHKREVSLWAAAGAKPTSPWYRELGAGMGAALNTAAAMNAYVLADRASWLKFANKGDLSLIFEGDPALFNQYAYIPIDPAKHPHVNFDGALGLEDWLVSAKGQGMIGAYRIDGETLFTPNATSIAGGTTETSN